ncbi:unnamed protein product [Rangifer tarandus platyrhynchus]|uniref:Uncharacterized protein n=1 Tax=Rangifer tarandus platyrhynchus TaxID=3082113 RepID=A0AC59YLL4_RANTA
MSAKCERDMGSEFDGRTHSSRVHTAPPGQPRALRARAPELGPPPLPLPAARFAARYRLGSRQRSPDGTRRKQLASIPNRPPDAPQAQGKDEQDA